MMGRALAITGLATMGLTGCGSPQTASAFRVVDTLRIDEGLVNVLVETSGPLAEEQLDAYAGCVAAKYALERGFGFARHIRTNRSETGGTWRADAVYSITPTLPKGSRTMDAEVTVQNCTELGIPVS